MPTKLNLDIKQIFVIGVATILFSLNIDSVVQAVKSIVMGSSYYTQIDGIITDLLIIILPLSIIQFYRQKTIGYILILCTLVYFAFSTLFYAVAFNSAYFNQSNLLLSLSLFFLKIIAIILMLQPVTKEKFPVDRAAVHLSILTALLLIVVIQIPNYFEYVSFYQGNFLLALLPIPSSLILLIVMVIWDVKLIWKQKRYPDNQWSFKRVYISKVLIVLASFLILLPYYFNLLEPLLGRGVYSVDGWGYFYPDKSPYYGLALMIFYIIPGILSFTLYQIASTFIADLKRIDSNVYWTVVLFYCLFLAVMVFENFSNW